MNIIEIARNLSDEVDKLQFSEPVTHVYNPFNYAREMQEDYLNRFASRGAKILLLGMNPGPWGMAQTGVPFGEVGFVRDWLKLKGKVDKPVNEHPKRLIEGLDCKRSEVSGARMWGWAKNRFETPEAFFDVFFVWNYCPLSFMEEGGRNRTPDKLPIEERTALFEVCDKALAQVAQELQVEWVVGVGAFAEKRAMLAIDSHIKFGRILHPSPASPKANAGWEEAIEAEFEALGISLKS
jgi:single-strand selective monofunctional uracil DNA glycosylase